ncbi:LysR substrate-binding domain-containing protein [Caballeronia sp.]|uniref:LysR substrate-binding domain-containing protein n=1 Tax=Caballeronia sp. TaxID=1931223 RepID=UPI003C5369FC
MPLQSREESTRNGLYKVRRSLPPLNAVKAFEAAARLGSITRAASELNVTPSAISQQIKSLEEHVGRKLVQKNKQELELLGIGNQGFADISHALDLIARAFQPDDESAQRVAFSTLPALASRWLNPQLQALMDRYPNLDLYIDCSPHLVDFSSESYDLALRFGQGPYDPLSTDRLFTERFQAVCAPILKTKIQEYIQRGQLHAINFICDVGMHSGEHVTWSNWLERRGLSTQIPERRIVCTDSNMSIDAALNGYGLLLGRHALVAQLLEQGALVALDEEPFETELGYFLVYPSLAGLSPAARTFRGWVLEQSKQLRDKYKLSF